MTVRVSGSTRRRAFSLGLALVFLVAIVPMAPASAMAVLDDDYIPGLPLTPQFQGSLDLGPTTFDGNDTFRIHLKAGERVSFTLTEHNPAVDLDIDIWSTSSTDFGPGGTLIWTANGPANPQTGTFTAPNDGWFYVVVYFFGPPPRVSGYTLRSDRVWAASPAPAPTERLWGSDRYTTAVQIAEKNFPGWLNCNDVIIASGEDRAAADPLAASGLTWTYGAPILLVQESRVPPSVMGALQGMQAQAQSNGATFTVHVVGGPVSVPPERVAEIQGAVPGVVIDRIAPYNDRFVLAGAIAQRMATERPGGSIAPTGTASSRSLPTGLIPTSSSMRSRSHRSPQAQDIRYCSSARTRLRHRRRGTRWNSVGIQARVVGGGPATVSDAILTDLASGGASSRRWAGSTATPRPPTSQTRRQERLLHGLSLTTSA